MEQVMHQLNAELAAHTLVRSLRASWENGVVTLRGSLPSLHAQQIAFCIAQKYCRIFKWHIKVVNYVPPTT